MAADSPQETPAPEVLPEMPNDPNRAMVELLVVTLMKDMRDPSKRTPSLMEVCRKLLSDNSVTIASVRKGDFGEVAARAAEAFPFNDDGTPRAANVMPMAKGKH